MRRILCVFGLAVVYMFGIGCAPKQVHKDWLAVGGSRSDATVKLGYTYNPQTEKPMISEAQGAELANKKCQAWGYEKAESFGSVWSDCSQSVMGPFGSVQCMKMNVMMEYQCIGKLPPDIETVSPASKK